MNTTLLQNGTTATATAGVDLGQRSTKTFQALGSTASGSGSATVQLQGSMNNTNWDTLGTISLTLGTTSTSDGFTSDDRYQYHRVNVTAISGTGANVAVIVGC